MRSHTFQIDVEAEKKSQLKANKKKVLYNPLSYFKRSKTLELDETLESPSIRDEIQRVLDKNHFCVKNQENDVEVISLRDIETLSTSNTINNSFKEDKKFLASAKSCFQIESKNNILGGLKNADCDRNDFFIKFFKEFKINIPKNRKNMNHTLSNLNKISIGINTSKEPSPINNNNKNFPFLQPNFLETALTFHNKMIIGSMQTISFPGYFQQKDHYYTSSMPNIPLSYSPFQNNQVMNNYNFATNNGGNFSFLLIKFIKFTKY